MARRKLNYREGDWFAVPLETGGYVLGLAARIDKKGAVLGYFFRPKYTNVPGPGDTENRHYEDVILVHHTGDLGLLEGTWPIVKPAENWDRALWPMPLFYRVDELRGRAYKVLYDENTLNAVEEMQCSFEEIQGLPKDASTGHWGTEIKLNTMLQSEEAVQPIDQNGSAIPNREPIEADGPDGGYERHSVKIHWKLSDGPEEAHEEMERLMEFDEKLAEKFQSEDLEYDGIERGQGWFIVFFYGRDADTMERKLMPIIRETKPRAGSYLIKAYGNLERKDVRVELA